MMAVDQRNMQEWISYYVLMRKQFVFINKKV